MKIKLKEKTTFLTIFFSLLFISLSVLLSYMVGKLNNAQLVIVLVSTFIVVFICVCFSLLLAKEKHEKVANEMIEPMMHISPKTSNTSMISGVTNGAANTMYICASSTNSMAAQAKTNKKPNTRLPMPDQESRLESSTFIWEGFFLRARLVLFSEIWSFPIISSAPS